MQEKKISSFFNSIHENKLKTDERPKCRQNTDVNRSNIFLDPLSRIMELKNKNKQIGPN